MVQTEDLNRLWLKFSRDENLQTGLRAELEDLFALPDYQTWWKIEPRERFRISSGNFPILTENALLDTATGDLQIKINKIGEKIFITDGAWVQSPMRVFPDPDEALVLLNHLQRNNLTDWPDWIVDPAAGCGHTPLGFSGRAKRLFCDANARALTFAHINALLNGMNSDVCLGLMNDMNRQLPEHLQIKGNTLFVANVPFAPAPDDTSLAINSGGGERGADLQVASFQLVKKFADKATSPVRACFLTWTLGSAEKNEWEVPRLCQDIFPKASVSWKLEEHDYDAPELPNPAPLKPMLQHLARSQYAVHRDNAKIIAAYDELADKLTSQGFTHIAYGFLDCELN